MNDLKKVFLDTSFFLRLLNPKEAYHQHAVSYFTRFSREKVQLFVSTLSIAEYGIVGKTQYLPFPFLTMLPFNIDHAKLAATFAKMAQATDQKGVLQKDSRIVIPTDTKLMAQAQLEDVELFVGRDEACSTIYHFLREKGLVGFNYLDLSTPPNAFYGELFPV